MSHAVTPVLTRQEIVDLARAAHRAPSLHNSQPWVLHGRPDGLDIDEDGSRSLPGIDPTGRERTISCGAAVRNVEIAVARLGRTPVTEVLPDGPAAPCVARVSAGAPAPVAPGIEALHRAIWARRTHRRIFMATHSSEHVLPALVEAVTPFGARIAVVDTRHRPAFAQLLWQAVQRQLRNDAAVRELADWTGPGRTSDGVPVENQATAPFPVDGLLTRTRARDQDVPPWVLQDLEQGTVAVLVTRHDDRLSWVQAGRALQSLLLTATARGLVASFLNQAVREADLRHRLAGLLDHSGLPQIVLRVGEPLVDVPPTPRRPLAEVLRA